MGIKIRVFEQIPTGSSLLNTDYYKMKRPKQLDPLSIVPPRISYIVYTMQPK